MGRAHTRACVLLSKRKNKVSAVLRGCAAQVLHGVLRCSCPLHVTAHPPPFLPPLRPPLHRYIAALLLSLGAMLHLELPHVNVLSKVDLVRQYGTLGAPTHACTAIHLHVRAAGDPANPPATHPPTPRPPTPQPPRPPDFSLDYYTEVQDLSYLVRAMGGGRFGARHRCARAWRMAHPPPTPCAPAHTQPAQSLPTANIKTHYVKLGEQEAVPGAV